MESIWSQTVQLPKRKKLDDDIRVQNVVIGAGIAGILIAYLLQEKGQEVIVLEAKEIASGQTKNTTAKITSQHGLIYHDMIKKCGLERAKGYAEANEAAIELYREIITKEGIACQFEELPSFLYSTEQVGEEKLKREAEVAKSLGIQAAFLEGEEITELPFEVTGAVRFDHQAQFHPLMFIQALAKKLTIYEHTKVLEVDDYMLLTDTNVIVADNVIFATHYPFPIVPGYYFLRQHQSRSYALAIEGEGVPKRLKGMYFSIDKDGLSFRHEDGKIILGGSTHRTGKYGMKRITDHGIDKTGFSHLKQKAMACYKNAEIIAAWAAQDCMPHDGIPFIGTFSKKHEHWYVATGFQKWGMTSAMVSAMIISDAIVGKNNPYAEVFSPQRFLVKAGIKNFLIDVGESICGLVKGFFVKKERKCSHMGCALVWNEDENTWDCPCHGSRYSVDGELIDNPAQCDIK